MYQKFSTDLSTQEIYANGDELALFCGKDRDEKGNKIYTYPETTKELIAVLKNPVLVSDDEAINAQIRDYAKKITARRLINVDKKTTEYD